MINAKDYFYPEIRVEKKNIGILFYIHILKLHISENIYLTDL